MYIHWYIDNIVMLIFILLDLSVLQKIEFSGLNGDGTFSGLCRIHDDYMSELLICTKHITMSQPKVNLYIWYGFGSPDADFSDLHKWLTSYHWKFPISCAYTCFTSISNINIKHTWILRYSVLFLLRSLKEIEAVLDFAKLERDEIKTETQSIYFSEHLDSEGIKLLELDNTVLEALESGEK